MMPIVDHTVQQSDRLKTMPSVILRMPCAYFSKHLYINITEWGLYTIRKCLKVYNVTLQMDVQLTYNTATGRVAGQKVTSTVFLLPTTTTGSRTLVAPHINMSVKVSSQRFICNHINITAIQQWSFMYRIIGPRGDSVKKVNNRYNEQSMSMR